MQGRWIVVAAWVSFAVFAVTIIADAAGLSAFDDLSAGVALVLFLVALPTWLYAFGLAVVRSSRGDDVSIGSLFFLHKSAPSDVRWWLVGSLFASLAVAFATAWANPFGVLEPMLPLALMGVWSTRYATYPAREVTPPARPSRPRAQPGGAR